MNSYSKVRLNAYLSRRVAEPLKQLVASQNISITKALTRAINTESFLINRRNQGAKVLINDGKGRLSELVFAR